MELHEHSSNWVIHSYEQDSSSLYSESFAITLCLMNPADYAIVLILTYSKWFSPLSKVAFTQSFKWFWQFHACWLLKIKELCEHDSNLVNCCHEKDSFSLYSESFVKTLCMKILADHAIVWMQPSAFAPFSKTVVLNPFKSFDNVMQIGYCG
jgi:hypothetical protein